MFKFDNIIEKTTKDIVKVSQRELVTENFVPFQVLTNDGVTVNVKFIDGCENSKSLHNLQFSNKLPTLDQSAIPPYIEMAFDFINEDSSVINQFKTEVTYRGKHRDRIKTIICEYINEDFFEEHSDIIYKSDIRTDIDISERGAFRVISLYQIEPLKHKKQKKYKHNLLVVLFDPYHLFIPDRNHGTKVFDLVKDYSADIKKLFNK